MGRGSGGDHREKKRLVAGRVTSERLPNGHLGLRAERVRLGVPSAVLHKAVGGLAKLGLVKVVLAGYQCDAVDGCEARAAFDSPEGASWTHVKDGHDFCPAHAGQAA